MATVERTIILASGEDVLDERVEPAVWKVPVQMICIYEIPQTLDANGIPIVVTPSTTPDPMTQQPGTLWAFPVELWDRGYIVQKDVDGFDSGKYAFEFVNALIDRQKAASGTVEERHQLIRDVYEECKALFVDQKVDKRLRFTGFQTAADPADQAAVDANLPAGPPAVRKIESV